VQASCYDRLVAVAAAAGAASSPQLPGGATPVVDLLGALEVGARVARSRAARARSPVHLIDLPETSVDGAVAVLVAGVGVDARLVLDDALAAALAPAVLGAPGGDVDIGGRTADIAVITSAVVCAHESEESKESNNVDSLHLILSQQ